MDVILRHVCVVDGRPSELCSEVVYLIVISLRTVTVVLDIGESLFLVFTGEEVSMISLSELIGVISILLASFGLGYKLGRDKNHNDKTKE